ncbi:MAG: hypothetical protein KAH24_10105 [Holophagae bacterium]|nr:hypothetical protein [Holophagae bacterium]
MTDWKKLIEESKKAGAVVRMESVPTFNITKAGALSLSSALRRDILSRRQDITHALFRYHEGEQIIMVEFLPEGSAIGARKISNMNPSKGTASMGFRSFMKQMGLKLEDMLGRHEAIRINDLDGEWWMFKVK